MFFSFFLKSSSCRLSSSWNRNKKSKVPIETTSSAPIFHSAKKTTNAFYVIKDRTWPDKTMQDKTSHFQWQTYNKKWKISTWNASQALFWLLERLRLSLFSGNPFRIMTYLERVGMARHRVGETGWVALKHVRVKLWLNINTRNNMFSGETEIV